MATAAAERPKEDGFAPRFVTAALKVEYLKPTPLGPELEIRGNVSERSERKAVVSVTISAGGTVTVKAEAVAVRIPKTMQ
jgi:acyl-coenzyme A thioesterase PaaI-like protein